MTTPVLSSALRRRESTGPSLRARPHSRPDPRRSTSGPSLSRLPERQLAE
ncbi:hypothetical protein IMZ48_46730 [Candidatus Bathyarchaeota archaeon]|nr:hypothetical protein [Candidatus Bathyarchaeota archaeon]